MNIDNKMDSKHIIIKHGFWEMIIFMNVVLIISGFNFITLFIVTLILVYFADKLHLVDLKQYGI